MTRHDIIQQLQEKGLRVTPQRAAVYANLHDRADHPTVEEIVNELNSELPISSKATVYSALAALREVGLVREVLLEEGVTRYDANVERHHHFRCRSCRAIEDIAWETFDVLQLKPLRPELQIETHEIVIYGFCEDCIAKD